MSEPHKVIEIVAENTYRLDDNLIWNESNLTRSNLCTDEKQDDYPYMVQEHLLADEHIDAETTGRPKRLIQLSSKYKDFVISN
ncbi:hypothetical protein A3Q56_06129 [Intoshia linei]|uniref:Uncharacterized protein n=1 Tax=Intoshia linei TaxID=1819745 RepID=A0A177AW02_9BILA|nr:hypothetical protein A3Q56_06129 [Intoshia linei]